MPRAKTRCARPLHTTGKHETAEARDRRKVRWRGYMYDKRFARYSLTADDFARIFEAQDGKCAYCRRGLILEGGTPLSAQIDHDHSCCSGRYKVCGKCIRGILCPRCNVAIGCLELDY